MDITDILLRHVRWPRAHRIIATRFPPIQLFERLSTDPLDWDAFVAIEGLVNPRLRQEIGEISLVPIEDRVIGTGASYVMGPFVHINPKGSRYSDGSYGVYYAGLDQETALRETIHHYELFYGDADEGIIRIEDMRVVVGVIDRNLHDITSLTQGEQEAVLTPDSYVASRALGQQLRDGGSDGVVYPSVRNPGGECVGAFRPTSVGIPVQAGHLAYHWDGHRINRVFDYGSQVWSEM
jgi:RES domain